ncbi:hypothetical protein OF83DRAFT_1171325 [Amylostereum chailletii]|nr:hypothetical protein OF83DRAFT_1171325 [Amylostereum chailletii]
MGILLIVEAAVAVCVLTTFSYTFHRWIIQRLLRIVPGVPSFITGNLLQMFTPDSFDFRANINRLHGKVVRINGALGESQLVITDTKALHHILIKDPHVFEDIDFFLEYGFLIA